MGGPFWKYVATPQPGDLVLAEVCKTCGKRRKWPIIISTSVTIQQRRTVSCAELLHKGEVGWGNRSKLLGHPSSKTKIITLCCVDSEEVLGVVVRTCWSKHKDGTPSKFWLIVRRRDTGQVHWATLGTCRILDSVEALAQLTEKADARP